MTENIVWEILMLLFSNGVHANAKVDFLLLLPFKSYV